MTNIEIVWNYLYKQIKNPYGTAGLMGNLKAESNFNPRNLQNSFEKILGLNDEQYTKQVDNGKYTNFIYDKAGYGLAQWTYWSLKKQLYDFTKKKNTSIGDLNTQLEFLIYQLSTYYPTVWNTLINCKDIQTASNIVLTQFERPKDQSLKIQQQRLYYGVEIYDQFIGKGEDMKIVDNLTTSNYQKGNNRKIKYIVIHYFGSLGTAKNISNYFKNPAAKSSAHYCVDEKDIIYRSVKDEDIAWHCGTRKGYKHPECRNANSIGIEVRPCKINKSNIVASDTDWYFDPRAIENTVQLVKQLMQKYNIPADRVIRHYDVTGKLCPRPLCGIDMNSYYKTSGDYQWQLFKQKIGDNININEEDEDDMTQDKFNEMMEVYLNQQAEKDASSWSNTERTWAESKGYIKGDNLNRKMYKKFMTREEMIVVLYRIMKDKGLV